MKRLFSKRNPFWPALFIVTLCGIVTYLVHSPTVGIDDANITQTYAKNIVDGWGYVYYEGGERVEGSTSLLWTTVNIIFYRYINI